MSTNNGISCFDPGKEAFANYDEYDGIQSREYNNSAFYKSKDGMMFFGGISGFNFFRPDEIIKNKKVYNITISKIQVMKKKITPGIIDDEYDLNLKYFMKDISFEFTSQDYTAPDRIRYAYILEGYDKGWNYVGNNKVAKYTNLKDGEYVFRVKSSNIDGLWEESDQRVRVRIAAPPWKSPVAYIGYIFFVLLLFYFLYRMILFRELHKLQKAESEASKLESLVRERTAELNRAVETLKMIAVTDKLTGLYNRRKFDDILTDGLRKAEKEGNSFSLLMGDIDHFKEINDEKGHLFGDEILQMIGKALQDAAGEKGKVARWGGEEFCIFLPETGLDDAVELAEMVRLEIAKMSRQAGLELTISFGVTEYQAGDSVDMMLIKADRALYRAKEAGRNRVDATLY